MRVVGYVGSPRVGGNTDALVSEVLRGAESADAETSLYRLGDLDIAPCQGCDACRRTGRCRQDDDMQAQYDVLLSADAVVIGTPIYWWGPTAQTKAFLDRWYAFERETALAGKPLLLVCAFGDRDPATARFSVGMFEASATWMGMPFVAPILASVSVVGDAARDSALMERAFGAGVRLARLL